MRKEVDSPNLQPDSYLQEGERIGMMNKPSLAGGSWLPSFGVDKSSLKFSLLLFLAIWLVLVWRD